ncbi:hypothetical protein [Tenacibaculum singaporense]|uniref:hypothetical protein n=1 Tax=Tenacibaculum singaporense TaxID=2358479 RepID=UPI000F68AA3A|nr:hypothetical protein [Tenacibaculum singaporense]RSC95044.1 hypothetical protein EI424_05195 [Tenacibaculum singaporense]
MKQNKETLKQFFETGDKPTQQQYSDLIDSYIDAKQPEGEANRRFVIDETGEVSVASEQPVPEYTLSPISGTNTVDLLKDGVSVSQIDLTPYLDNTNLARLVSGTVDANGVATFTRDDNSTFTVDLSNLKDTVPQYQAGTNITIDNTDPDNPVINASGEGATDVSNLVPYTGATQDVDLGDKKLISKETVDIKGNLTANTSYIDKNEIKVSSSFSGDTNSSTLDFKGLRFDYQNRGTIGVYEHDNFNLSAGGNTILSGSITGTNTGYLSVGKFGTIEDIGATQLTESYVNFIGETNTKQVRLKSDKTNTGVFEATLQSKTHTIAGLDDIPQIQAGSNITIDNTDPLQPVINATGGSGGATDLSYDAATRTVASSTGTDAVIPLANATNAGLQKANFYEEGTFTATLLDHDTGATYSISSQTSQYTRVGNLVQLTINLENITTSGTVSGASLRIGNIPFNAANFIGFTSGTLSSFRNSELSDNDAKDLVPVITSNSDYVHFNQNGVGFSGGNFTNGNIRLTISYKTNVYIP